jgi:CheY-like chemotaxis protein
LLLITGNQPLCQEIQLIVGAPDIEFAVASSPNEALDIITSDYFDGIIIDWVISDQIGIEFVEDVQARLAPFVPPFLIFGTRKLGQAQAAELHRLSQLSVVRYAPSPERLLDETMLLLHRSEGILSDRQKTMLEAARQADPILAGRKVLVIDDDLRNIFAITSVFEQRNLQVLNAENGVSGIEVLRKNPDVDIVLMDITMPGIDGYETTRNIRSIPEFENLPIIALTAKAMKGDRDKCLQAGASDYVTKPVDLDHLLSVMRVCFSRIPVYSRASANERGKSK